MKKTLLALLFGSVLVFAAVPASADETTDPDPVTVSRCEVVQISGPTAHIQCYDSLGNIIPAGLVNLPEVIKEIEVLVPGPTITLPPLTLPPITIPGPTKTVEVPGPTSTKTVTVIPAPQIIKLPGEERTVRVPGPVVTKTPQAVPGATETATVTVAPEPGDAVDTDEDDDVSFDLPTAPAAAVGYSVLALLIVCCLIVFGLWMGYLLGWNDKAREEKKFLSALRDQFYYKGEHR